jgi:transposase-like protein
MPRRRSVIGRFRFARERRRGLPDPLLVISDGAPGLIRAIEECFPRSARQRCLAHKLRNLQSKVPEDQWPEFKAHAIACYQAASPALARLLRDDMVSTYGDGCSVRSGGAPRSSRMPSANAPYSA